MITVKQAYVEALKNTEAKYLKRILSFDIAFGFIFGNSRTEVEMGAVCIIIGKEDPKVSALVPIVFENLDFIDSGKEIPLNMVL